MFKFVIEPETFDEMFLKGKTKWAMVDMFSRAGINLFPFISLKPVKLAYIMSVISKGHNPFRFYEEAINMSHTDFDNLMMAEDYNKFKITKANKNIKLSRNIIDAYNYNLSKYIRQTNLLGEKTTNKLSNTNLSFADYTTYDNNYLIPVMVMTFVNASDLKYLAEAELKLESEMFVIQKENVFIVSYIRCKPIEIQNI